MSIRPIVEDYVSAGGAMLGCEEIRQHVQERVGYPVTGTAVSRVMGNLGFERFKDRGRVHFKRPENRQ